MTQTIWDALLVRDQALFSKINGQWTSTLADHIMPWIRTANNWDLMYGAILAYLFIKWGNKAWKWILIVAVNIALTDQISSSFFKPFVHRLRPCADPAIMYKSRLLLEHCSGGFSFTSSHAANHFGLAMFVFMTLQPLFKKYTILFFVWAALIAYAQVYVGVHYPLDIFAGSLIGLVVGYFMGKLFLKWQPVIDQNLKH
jgi:membrane-associated phospholipid phosphatase